MAVAPSISYGPIPMYGALKSAHSMQCMRLRSILATRRQTHDAGRDEMAGQIDMTKLRQAPSVDRELVSASRDLPGGRAYVDAGVQHDLACLLYLARPCRLAPMMGGLYT
jgi:hypothetical protein